MAPRGPAGVSSTPSPRPGMASRGTDDRLARCEKQAGRARTRRRGPGAPSRTGPPGRRWGRRRPPRCGTSGPARLRSRPPPVWPAVVRPRPRAAAPRVTRRGARSATTSSGHSTSAGGRPPSWPAMSAVATNSASYTTVGSMADWRSPRTPPPCTAATRSVRTAGPPSGASAPHTDTPITTARARSPASMGPRRRGDAKDRATDGAALRRWSSPERPTPSPAERSRGVTSRARPAPPSHTRATTASGPPRRAAPASGPPPGRAPPRRWGGPRRASWPAPPRSAPWRRPGHAPAPGASRHRHAGHGGGDRLEEHEDDAPVAVEARHPPQTGDEHPQPSRRTRPGAGPGGPSHRGATTADRRRRRRAPRTPTAAGRGR